MVMPVARGQVFGGRGSGLYRFFVAFFRRGFSAGLRRVVSGFLVDAACSGRFGTYRRFFAVGVLCLRTAAEKDGEREQAGEVSPGHG